jgi:hypothetical protein
MSSIITKAFIPRVLPNVTISQIRDVFAAKQIGKVTNIDMRHRKNENNNLYSFVFLELALYNTKEAAELNKDIANAGLSKVFYDKKNYWEVKSFLSKTQRISMISFPAEEEPEEPEQPDAEEEHFEEIPTICSDLLTPTYSYDIALRRMSVHSQLLRAHFIREVKKSACYKCGKCSNPHYARSIFWKNYAFCSQWCQYDTEYTIHTSWQKSQQKPEPVQQTYMDEYGIFTTTQPPVSSKFLEMFKRIQEETDQEMRIIRSLCGDILKRPSVFTAQDRKEMEQEYEQLAREIMA